MHILDHEAPGLASQIEAMPLEQRQLALTKAAVRASQKIIDLEPEIQQLLEAAAKDGTLSPEQIAKAQAYMEYADDRYFTLQEEGAAEVVWGNWFAKARLAAAIVSIFSGTSWQESARAVYELCFTSDDKAAVIALVRAEIESASKSE